MLLKQPLLRLQHELGLSGLIARKQMIPNWRVRFCTRQLKIEMCQKWINTQSDSVVLYVGLRADEEGRESGREDQRNWAT